ncbi:MAG TPA: S8/S53 family peptidase, partial [Rhodothermia bacterium]
KHGLNTSSVAVGFDEGNLIGGCYGAHYIFATTEYSPSPPKELNQEEDFFVAGIEWMERMGVDIVNVSLGYSTFDEGQRSYTYEDMDGDTAITTRAADRAAGLGVVVVTSAGNESCTAGPEACWYYITSPADGDSVITAGASNIPDSLGSPFTPANFSGAGPTFDGRIKPDVSAPGLSIYYATSNGSYSGGGGGTSFSSPLIASVACQILQANPSLNPIDVRTILRSTAHMAANPDNKLGWGVINAKAAVDLAKIAVTSSDAEGIPDGSIAISLYPNPAVEQSLLTVETPAATENLQISLFDVLGREVIRTRPNRLGSAVSAAIDVRHLPAGTYYVRVFGDHVDETHSLVVTH